MILTLPELVDRYRFPVGSVLHLGARLGEERDEYDAVGAREITWVEADPDVCAELAEAIDRPGHRVVQAVVSDADDVEVDFHVASNRSSSSILTMKLHTEAHPEAVVTGTKRLMTTTVDTLCARAAITQPDLLVLDLQGAELLALRGATWTLAAVAALYTEVSIVELYEGGVLIGDLDDFLAGFARVETVMTPFGWGDALYLPRRLVTPGMSPRHWFSPVKGRVEPIEVPPPT